MCFGCVGVLSFVFKVIAFGCADDVFCISNVFVVCCLVLLWVWLLLDCATFELYARVRCCCTSLRFKAQFLASSWCVASVSQGKATPVL